MKVQTQKSSPTAISAFKGKGIQPGVPDSILTREATDLLREYSTELLFNHSHRVFFFASAQGDAARLNYDPEILFICAAFHDLGLVKQYNGAPDRFEVVSANAARQFLAHHKVPEATIQTAWDAISLHTTPGITQYKQPEVALLYTGVGLDVLGEGYYQFPEELRRKIVAEYPRTKFKDSIVRAFLGGFEHKTQTTIGTVNEDVCARLIPGYVRSNFCDQIANSPFEDS
jgi:hypothetical protein